MTNNSNAAVSTEAMQRAANLFMQKSDEATGMMRTVNESQNALRSSWTGDASFEFGKAMNDWEANLQIIIKELNGMIETMGVNASVYIANESEATALAGRWADGLPDL